MKNIKEKQRGYVLVVVIGIVSVLFILVLGLVNSVMNENWFSVQEKESQVSMEIAEAGLNYYMWFLNHNPGDYQDGQGVEGPYYHDYRDGDGNLLGRFRLEITAPSDGSSIIGVRSTGETQRGSAPSRTIEAQVGIPSLAKYAFLTQSDIWFGPGESVDGQLHSNGGIRFDGTCNDVITSAKTTYTCQAIHGCEDETKPGIWGDGGPDSFWEFPVSPIDFDQISGDLSDLEETAALDATSYEKTNKYGYQIILHSNDTATPADDTYDLYKVTKVNTHTGWTVDEGNQNYGDDIKTRSPIGTYSMPAHGVIFCDDQVWVEGETSSRITIAAGHFPEQAAHNRSIIINDDITYYAKDGSAVVGLIAQKDVRVNYGSPNNLEVDAVMLAQRGKVIRPYYFGSTKSSITTFGSVITNKIWTWTWSSGGIVVDGYQLTYSSYDPHLIYAPPPYFPSTGEYEILSWEEILPE